MKIDVNEDGSLLLTEVFNTVNLKTASGEELSICMRDDGFEFKYQDAWYSAQRGNIIKFNYEQ